MKIPKIFFQQMPLKLETEMFSSFLNSDWNKYIFKKYPQFLEISKIRDKKKRLKLIKQEIIDIRQAPESKMNEGLLRLESDWRKVENKTLQILSDIIQTDYPNRNIVAYVSINPICPRFLDTWSFSVPPNHNNPNKTMAHEISHFLFFKKLKETFPKIEKYKYESPHNEWILSEILAVIMLADKRVTKVLNIPPYYGYYPAHKKLKINGQLVTKWIEKIYNEAVIKKNNFPEFIDRGLEIVRRMS